MTSVVRTKWNLIEIAASRTFEGPASPCEIAPNHNHQSMGCQRILIGILESSGSSAGDGPDSVQGRDFTGGFYFLP